MVMWYWSVDILFWQLSIDHIMILWMSTVKDVDLPRHAWDTPFLLIVCPTLPVQPVDEYVRTLGQLRDNQTKRGWPYSMSMGLWSHVAMSAKMFLQTFCYSVCKLGEFWTFKNLWRKFNKLTPGFYVPVLLLMITLSKRSGSTMMLFLWNRGPWMFMYLYTRIAWDRRRISDRH